MEHTCPDIGKKKGKEKKIEDVILHWIMNIVRLSYTWRVSFGLNNICLSCSRFVSVLFVVFVKIELDNVVKENYSSQIVEAKITVYESLRVRQVTDHKFLEGKIESLTMRKSYSS